ncbi:MAG: hypothetical protein AAGB32_02925 [Pseudomonadota bacterium]
MDTAVIKTDVKPKEALQKTDEDRIIVRPAAIFEIPEKIDLEEWLQKAQAIMRSNGIFGSFEQPSTDQTNKTRVAFRFIDQINMERLVGTVYAEIGNITANPKPYVPGPSTLGDDAHDPKLVRIRAEQGEAAAAKLLETMQLRR